MTSISNGNLQLIQLLKKKEFVIRLNIHTCQFKLFARMHVYSFNFETVSKVY